MKCHCLQCCIRHCKTIRLNQLIPPFLATVSLWRRTVYKLMLQTAMTALSTLPYLDWEVRVADYDLVSCGLVVEHSLAVAIAARTSLAVVVHYAQRSCATLVSIHYASAVREASPKPRGLSVPCGDSPNRFQDQNLKGANNANDLPPTQSVPPQRQ